MIFVSVSPQSLQSEAIISNLVANSDLTHRIKSATLIVGHGLPGPPLPRRRGDERNTITLDVLAVRSYVKSLIVEAGNADEGAGPLGLARKAQISE
jgi:hypothetical protein